MACIDTFYFQGFIYSIEALFLLSLYIMLFIELLLLGFICYLITKLPEPKHN